MPILLADLIAKLPSDTEEKVKKARDKFNNKIREALRRETRLAFRSEENRSGGVPIQLAPGLPSPLIPFDKQTIDDKHRLALMLAPYRQTLSGLRDTASVAESQLVPELRKSPTASVLLDGRERHFEPTRQYADYLLQKLKEFELTRFILRVDEDVLGVYRYRLPRAGYDEPEPKIELYWGVIGLVARDLSVDIEDLTVVILAHELAHAYTHVGLDADDHCWPSDNFKESAHELKEGLAQFYTQLVCDRLKNTSPGPQKVFEALLPQQPAAYQTHIRWSEYSPEHVRLAMLETRRARSTNQLSSFERCLEGARRQLRRSGTGSDY